MGLLCFDIGHAGRDEYLVKAGGEEFGFTLSRDYLGATDGEHASAKELRDVGYLLYRCLFQTKGLKEAAESGGGMVLCVASDDAEVHAIPWELLWSPDGQDHLLRRQACSLYHSGRNDVAAAAPPGLPLRLLTVISLPFQVMEEGPLNVLGEWEAVQDVLLPYRKGLRPEVEERASLKVLREEHFYQGGGCDILHFIGHGARGGVLLLENDAGPDSEPRQVGADELSELLRGRGIQAVFLNACETGRASAVLPGLMQSLHMRAGIPVLLGYQRSVADQWATEFARSFYRFLFEETDIHKSLALCRRKMPPDGPWWLPVLWLHRTRPGTPFQRIAPARRSQIRRDTGPVPLVGEKVVHRYSEVRKAGRLLRDQGTRVVLIHGTAGSGKFSLASYLAQFFGFLFRRVVTYRFGEDPLPRPDVVGKAASREGSLLILDDFERVQDENGVPTAEWEAVIRRILDGPGRVKAILTSQVAVHLRAWKPGELPLPFEVLTIGGFQFYETALFLSARLRPEDRDALLGRHERVLADVLGRHPLALELLVRKGTQYGFDTVIQHMDQYLLPDLEQRGMSAAAAKFAAEETTDLLSLGVVPMGVPAEYLAEVPVAAVLYRVELLALLEPVGKPEDRRYRLAPVFGTCLRQRNAGRFQEAARRVGTWCEAHGLELEALHSFIAAGDFGAAYRRWWELGSGTARGTEHLTLYDLTRQLLDQAREPGPSARLAYALGVMARDRGRYDEAEGCYLQSLEIRRMLGDESGVSKSMHQLGILSQYRGRYDEAERFYRKSLEIKQKLGDVSGASRSLHQLGTLSQARGRYDEAEGYYRQSLGMMQELADVSSVSKSLHQLGILAQDRGRYDGAEGYYRKSLEISQKLGDVSGVSKSLHQLGTLAQARGRYDEAEGYYRKSIEICRELGDVSGENKGVGQLGSLAQERGRYEEAEGYYRQSLGVFRQLGDVSGESKSVGQLGSLSQDRGRYEEAEGYYRQSLEISQRIGDVASAAISARKLGMLAQERGRYDEAEGYYLQSLEISQKLGDVAGLGGSLHQLGTLAQLRGKFDEAGDFCRQSLENCQRLGDAVGEAISRAQLGSLALARGRGLEDVEAKRTLLQTGLVEILLALEVFWHRKSADLPRAVGHVRQYEDQLGSADFERLARQLSPTSLALYRDLAAALSKSPQT